MDNIKTFQTRMKIIGIFYRVIFGIVIHSIILVLGLTGITTSLESLCSWEVPGLECLLSWQSTVILISYALGIAFLQVVNGIYWMFGINLLNWRLLFNAH